MLEPLFQGSPTTSKSFRIMGEITTVSAQPQAAEMIKVQDEDELRLAQMGWFMIRFFVPPWLG